MSLGLLLLCGVAACEVGDADGDAQIPVNEILSAVNNALQGGSFSSAAAG